MASQAAEKVRFRQVLGRARLQSGRSAADPTQAPQGTNALGMFNLNDSKLPQYGFAGFR
jgi:hypothetical protein